MRYLDLTLPTPMENLALDEALLEEAEAAAARMETARAEELVEPQIETARAGEMVELRIETLRLWESLQPMVVVGRSSHVETEVRVAACRAAGIPILRRTSGGATIVAGPGCLMYALVLSYRLRPQLRVLSQAHRTVLGVLAAALTPLAPGVQCRGTSDMALGALKFSGNSARCRREYLLYHGTLLYDFPLDLIEECLAMPPRMPDYREHRSHGRFVTNLPVPVETIRQSLVAAWDAQEPCNAWPAQRTAQLVAEKYSLPEWNGVPVV